MQINRYQTGGLHEVITIAVGAQVSLVKNIDVATGLVNGSSGIIVNFDIDPQQPLNGTIYIKFSNENVGRDLKLTCPENRKYLNAVPIQAISVQFQVSSTKIVSVSRTQYPITLAWSSTIHKVQGQTLHQVAVSFEGGKFTVGQAYVAISHSKSLSGLHLLNFQPEKIHVNNLALAEMTRMRENCNFECQQQIFTVSNQNLIISHLNIRSLNVHIEDLRADDCIKYGQVIALTESYWNDKCTLPCIGLNYTFFNR